jgi:putative chitinase
MIRKLFRKIRAAGQRAERIASVAPYVKETAKNSHDAPGMSKTSPQAKIDAAVDAALKDAPVIPEREVSLEKPAKTSNILPDGKFNPEAFYAQLREGPLRHRSTEQVAGTNAILDTMAGEPISWAAYALATAWHETGGKMSPNAETLNYSVAGLLNTFGRHRISRADAERLGRKPGEPPLPVTRQRAIGNIIYGGAWGRDNLGNTEPNDGWTYRGRGMAHDTGRRNYDLSGKAVGLDLLAHPEKLLDLATAAKVMASGMKSGRYTGRAFVHFLPTVGEATAAAFGQARRIINSTDKAGDIAGHALLFQRALRAGGWV